jgi:lipopolysaccharide/colanic/teichoic acid biosynthesis glycosyltransferase
MIEFGVSYNSLYGYGSVIELAQRQITNPGFQPRSVSEKYVALIPNTSVAYRLVKRFMDITGSLLLLILLSPVFIITVIAIKIEDPKGSVFYSQKRAGYQGRPFDFSKFRSMIANADAIKDQLCALNEMDGPVFKIKNDPRVTKVGRIIRKMSIDELPQLWNVLKGDMSLVGPRPLPVAEAMACNAYQRQRELVRPGITCYWQVSGRNNMNFEEWVELDLQYIREQGLGTDIKLLLKTVPAVLKAEGAS